MMQQNTALLLTQGNGRVVQRMMAAPTVDFGKIEARAVMKFLFLQGKGVVEIHGEMKDVLKDDCPSYSTVKMWVSRFQTGHFKVTDEPRSRRPTSATTEEKADAVHIMILEDRQISAKVIAETLEISHKRVGHIILDMRKLSAKWVLKCLNADQKRIRVTTSKVILDQFAAGMADFMARLVTMDETWLHHYDHQSMEWQNSGSPHPKKLRTQKSAGKVLASVFWDKDGVLLIKYLPKGCTINA
ncbi:histone-lysine N-methyltransferase SETMAR-like [Oratosquilla oratoria]|uniref:histone-lysine N-methyltransferase SETMAR-like n=1 Tax=Oratosquilla oratoria TaxID=337810 RepID=UPI003F76F6C2